MQENKIWEFIKNRQSAMKGEIGLPIPDDAALKRLMEAAMSAPDHGGIRAARFFILHQAGQEKLADLYEAEFKKTQENPSPEEIAAQRQKAFNAPLLIIMAAQITQNHPKVPEIEQIIGASMASYGLILSLEAAGYLCRLITGGIAHGVEIKEMLGLAEKDQMIGFLQVGSPIKIPAVKKRLPTDKAFCLFE